MNPVSPAVLVLLALAALAVGLAAGIAFARARAREAQEIAVGQAAHAAEVEQAALRERLRAAEQELAARRAEFDRARQQSEARLAEAESRAAAQSEKLAELRARTDAERTAAADKLRLLEDARTSLTDQFRNLANDILEEKARRFSEQNQAHLGQLLDPLRTQLSEFKGKVEEVYVQEGKDRSALQEQVRQLITLNQTLSRDAANLTSALKGQAKTQGNWGELILERVLEASGLRKGQAYHVQDSQVTDDGRRLQPDVVIELPGERKLVVDAKVSLVDYDRYTAAESEDDRTRSARGHVESIRTHMRGLSAKRYQDLYGIKSLDMVVMFVPVEPAFMLAVTHDEALFMEAWQRNVLLVSPSTLLFVVRTIAHLWRQEAQSRNAQDIARRGSELYDKLAAFVADLQKVGAKLKDAQSAYEDAERKLAHGRGNVIRQAQMLKEMGVKSAKALPSALVEAAGAADEAPAAPAAPLGSLPLFDSPDPDAPLQ